jgi:hypothetical protein
MSIGMLLLLALYYLPHFLAILMILSLIVVAKHLYLFECHVRKISHVLSTTFGKEFETTAPSTFDGLNHMLQTGMLSIFSHARLVETYNIQVVILASIQFASYYVFSNTLILISSMVGFLAAFFVFVYTHKNIGRLKQYERLMGKAPVQEVKDGH